MAKQKRAVKLTECICCRDLCAPGDWEAHHWPIPKRLRGSETVPLCRDCHNTLDRTRLDDWPRLFTGAALEQLFAVLDRPAKLLFMKFTTGIYEVSHEKRRLRLES